MLKEQERTCVFAIPTSHNCVAHQALPLPVTYLILSFTHFHLSEGRHPSNTIQHLIMSTLREINRGRSWHSNS